MEATRLFVQRVFQIKYVGPALIVVNLFSFVWGLVFWYGDFILRAPVYFWPFIPDCPLFALLFASVLILWRTGRSWAWYEAIVAYGCILYGFWTVFFWVAYWLATGDFNPTSLIMTGAHIGLFFQGVALLPLLRLRAWIVALAAGWFAASAWVDYGVGWHPPIPMQVSIILIQNETLVVTTVLAVLFTALLLAQRKAPALSRATWPNMAPSRSDRS
jgi:uncharacterized membrane protein YpjA